MTKKNYFFLFLISLLTFSLNFLFQKTPGYMDSEYYFLGGKYLSQFQLVAPVIWNFLDDPTSLPHSLFTYWMPFPSILSMLSILLFGNFSFFTGRLFFWIIAAGIPPLSAFVGYSVFKNKFTAWIAGLLAVFCGYYFKYYTITESVTIYIFFGGLFFLLIDKLLKLRSHKCSIIITMFLGILTGILHMTRVDGLFFIGIFFVSLFSIYKNYPKKNRAFSSELFQIIICYLIFYMLVTGWWYFRNYELFSSLFTPASSKALWIASYDDTFIYPATQLNFQYWLENGFPLKIAQIWNALKSNIGNLIAVQFGIIGMPLLIFSVKKINKVRLFLYPYLYFLITFFLMTFVFSESGSRGGYLHSISAIQIFIWVLIAGGTQQFIEWGIRKRNWMLLRSQVMFGSALIAFSIIFTSFVYVRDVIGTDSITTNWDRETVDFIELENQIIKRSDNSQDVIMINDPVGYHLATNRWSIVIPKTDWFYLRKLIQEFNVRYIVLDKNLPDELSNIDEWDEMIPLTEVFQSTSGKILYEVNK